MLICFLQIVTPNGFKHLISIPKACTGEPLRVRPGNYVLIQATEKGSKYRAEILRVIDCEYEKFYRMNDLWPTPFDIPGYVERLAEQIQRAKAEKERLDQKAKKEKKKPEEKPTELCIKCNIKKGNIFGKDKCRCVKKSELVVKVPSKRELLCKKVCKSDKACLAESPIFPDDDVSLIIGEPPKKNNCSCVDRSTNTQCTTTLGTNTRRDANISSDPCKKVQKDACKSASAPRLKICCVGSKSKTSVSCGPDYARITVSRELLPEVYGKCTPWQMTKKELRKHSIR